MYLEACQTSLPTTLGPTKDITKNPCPSKIILTCKIFWGLVEQEPGHEKGEIKIVLPLKTDKNSSYVTLLTKSRFSLPLFLLPRLDG